MRYLSALIRVWVTVLLVLTGCGLLGGGDAGLKLTGSQKDKMTQKFVGREYVLASSLYATEFFGDRSKWFVDARPFDIIKLYRHSGEETAVPAQKGEVIPAGTPVRVVAVDYPVDPLTAPLSDRANQVLAPTAHTWLLVSRTDKPENAPLVFVLPKEIESEDAFVVEVQKRLASPQSMTALLAHSDPTHLASVFEKKVVNGMSRAAMFAALGEPKNAAQQENLGTLEFVADYGDLQITVQGNVVSKVVSLREEAAIARQAAEEAAQKAREAAEEKRKQDEADRAARAELEKQKAAEAEAARKERETVAAKERAEADKKQALIDADNQRKAEQQARLDAAKAKKEEAERERLRRIEDAKAKADLARAEAEALKAQKKAEADAAKAEAEAVKAQKKAQADAARAEADAATSRSKLAADVAKAEAEAAAAQKKADEAKKLASAAQARTEPVVAPAPTPAPAPVKAEPVLPPPPRKVGVKLSALTKDKAFDLKYTSLEGALVVATTAGGAAEAAGLLADDIVLSVDATEVTAPEVFTNTVSASAWEKALKLSVWRGGKKITLTIAGSAAPKAVAPVPTTTSTSPTAQGPVAPVKAKENKSMLPSRRNNEAATSDGF